MLCVSCIILIGFAPFLYGHGTFSLVTILSQRLRYGKSELSVQHTLNSCSNYIILHKIAQVEKQQLQGNRIFIP